MIRNVLYGYIVIEHLMKVHCHESSIKELLRESTLDKSRLDYFTLGTYLTLLTL